MEVELMLAIDRPNISVDSFQEANELHLGSAVMTVFTAKDRDVRVPSFRVVLALEKFAVDRIALFGMDEEVRNRATRHADMYPSLTLFSLHSRMSQGFRNMLCSAV